MNLYAHQQKILDEDPKKTGLFLGTGSGKTRIALMLAQGKTLVICPKTQKEDGNWEREAKTIHPDMKSFEFTEKGGIYHELTISKEVFRRDHESLPAFDTVIIDEAHTCLGVTPNTRWRKKVEIPKTSQLFEALDEYLTRTKPERIYLCTATIMKSPFTVWAAGKVLGKIRGDLQSFFNFRRLYYTKLPMPGREVYVPKSDSATKDSLAALVRSYGSVGRLEDFFDVPDQTFRTDHIELTGEQKERIKELPSEYPDPIVQVGKRHQIENGCLSGDEFSEGQRFANGKIAKILDYAAEFPKMVIFARYKAQIAQIERELMNAGYFPLVMTGDMKDRGWIIAEANKAKECIFICQAQISAGWELPDFPVMIFASRTYSFVDYDQALGRIQRANNIKKNLYINLVVKGGTDEAVDASLANKSDFNERLYLGV